MEQYVTNIKDLVFQALTSNSKIQYKANNDDHSGCFQMGMIYLLGINTAIDFKKASQYLGSQALSDNQDANCLLGFIAECEGNFSQAFHYYAKTESGEKDSYLEKVIKGRSHIQDYLKKLDLPTTLNKEVSSILSDYAKGKASRTGACVKVAAICEDEPSCLEAAKALFEAKDYISAIQWIKKGNVSADNSICVAINERFDKSKKDLLSSKLLQVVDLNSNSLLSKEDPTQFLNNVKKACDEASKKCLKEWRDKSKAYVNAIIKNKKDQEQQEYLAALAEEEARKKKRNKLIKYCAIAATAFVIILFASVASSSDKDSNDVKEINGSSEIIAEKEMADIKPSDNESSVPELSEEEQGNNTTPKTIKMSLSGIVGGEAEFVMEGATGWYRMTYEGADKTKRTLELDSYDPKNNNCVINAYLRGKYIGRFVGTIKNDNYKVDKYEGIFESVKGAKLDFKFYSE